MGEPPVPGRTARVSRPFSVRRYWTGICGGMSGGGGGLDIGPAVSGDAAGLCHGDRPRSGFEPSPAPRSPSEQARCLRGPRSDPATPAKTTRMRPRTRVPSKFDSRGRSGLSRPGDGLALEEIIFATLSASYMYNYPYNIMP